MNSLTLFAVTPAGHLARMLAKRYPTIFGGPEVRMTKLQREVAELAKLIRERCGTPPA